MKRSISIRAAIVALMLVLTMAVPAWADTAMTQVVAQAGTTTSLDLLLTNDTAVAHSYELTATGLPSGLSAQFAQAGPSVSSVQVGAHGSTSVTLKMTVPPDARLGRCDVTFVARRDDQATAEERFVLDVESAYALKITSSSKNVSAFSGQNFTFDVSVLNSGSKAVTGVAPTLEMPSKWVLSTDPAAVARLEPGAEAVFHLTVAVPASQVAIDQPVSVSVASDQATSPSSGVAVRVQSNPSYMPVAAGVVVAALAGVAFYFRRKGRR